MSKKEDYRQRNELFLAELTKQENVKSLAGGVLYEVIETAEGKTGVTTRSIVTCHYKGSLINGKVFDNSWERGCPEAFRVSDLIEGFQIALCNMRVGDHWKVYIPWQKGYGKRSDADIPGYSTLIFEILLLGIG